MIAKPLFHVYEYVGQVAVGDRVIVEELTYEPAVAAFRARGADVLAVGAQDGNLMAAVGAGAEGFS
jgi:DNA-binding transcriptional MocR family regulator